jgi:hypothetical protein
LGARGASLVRALLINVTSVTDRGSEMCIYYENQDRSMHMLGYGLHLFRKDAVPHSVLVVAIIFVAVLLIL